MPPPRPTHFLSIPLASDQLSQSWFSFRNDVTRPATSYVVAADAIRPLGTLHLTLGVMRLNPGGVDLAVDVLRNLNPSSILAGLRSSPRGGESKTTSMSTSMSTSASGRAQTLLIALRGLHPIRPPTSRASVLYATPSDPDGLLQPFCELLRQPFIEAGLLDDSSHVDDGRPSLLLHATIVNTVYMRRGNRHGQRMTIDARDLVARYGDYQWVQDMPINRIALCRMGAKKVDGADGDEAYEVEADVAL